MVYLCRKNHFRSYTYYHILFYSQSNVYISSNTILSRSTYYRGRTNYHDNFSFRITMVCVTCYIRNYTFLYFIMEKHTIAEVYNTNITFSSIVIFLLINILTNVGKPVISRTLNLIVDFTFIAAPTSTMIIKPVAIYTPSNKFIQRVSIFA